MDAPKPFYRPDEYVEIVKRIPVVRRRMERADVTWLRDADGWWWLMVNGEASIGLDPATARRMAEEIFYGAPSNPEDPVPEVG